MDYEEKLALAKEALDSGSYDKETIEYIFPELAESEDERIRKAIIESLSKYGYLPQTSIKVEDAIAWLEKQVEQKPAELAKGEDYGIDGLWHAQRILEKTFGKVDGYQTDDGILSHECAISAVKELYEQKPAWSEEDERMFEQILQQFMTANNDCKLHNASFTYDKEISFLKSLKGRVQPKQEWSEEDECYMSECIGAIATKDGWSFEEKRKTKHWLKSLKQRIGG